MQSHVQLFCKPMNYIACQTPLPRGFPRQKYWSGLPLPSPGKLLDPGTEPTSLALADGFFTIDPPGKPKRFICWCSVAKLCPTLCDHMDCSIPAFPVLHHFPEFAQTHVHWVGDAIQPSQSSAAPFSRLWPLPASESFPIGCYLCIRWPKYGSFSFSLSPSNEYSGLISFRIDWFDLLVVQENLKNLLQHHN